MPKGYYKESGLPIQTGKKYPGRKLGDETKQKISLTLTGRVMPVEIKQKISNTLKGRKLTKEHKRKMALASAKFRHTEETKAKLSLLRKGKQVGKDNPNWKGGKASLAHTARTSIEYKRWRRSVFTRDNYQCVECGYRGFLHAHHIKSFADYPELRFNLENGTTLCVKCHEQTDTYKIKRKKKT